MEVNLTMNISMVIGIWIIGMIFFFPINRYIHSVFKDHTFMGFKSIFHEDVETSCLYCGPERKGLAFIWPLVLIWQLVKLVFKIAILSLSPLKVAVWILEGGHEVSSKEE